MFIFTQNKCQIKNHKYTSGKTSYLTTRICGLTLFSILDASPTNMHVKIKRIYRNKVFYFKI